MASLKAHVPVSDRAPSAHTNSPVYYWHKGQDEATPAKRNKSARAVKRLPASPAKSTASTSKRVPRPAKRKVKSVNKGSDADSASQAVTAMA